MSRPVADLLGVDTVDAVIVGSGPGGSTAADVLTAAGWSVVMLERGRNHLVDAEAPYDRKADYSNDEVKFLRRWFLGPDPLVEPRTFRRDDSTEREHVGDVNNLPATVGGGGVHADGKLPRFRAEDFQLLTTRGPVDNAAVADWPLTYDDLEPYYAEAERLVGVAGEAGANPYAEWRSGPYPMPPGADMYGATLTATAATELGYHPYRAPTGVNSVAYDGRPACNNCGFCAFYGCPIHAKGDPVAPLQRALRTGRLRLLAETFASRIVTSNGRATGVDVIGPGLGPGHIAARHVVVAGGAMETPRLLLLSGIGGDQVGRNLMFHFQTLVFGAFPQRLHSDRGRAVTHLHDDPIVPDAAAMAAAKEAGLPWIRGGIVEHGGAQQPISEAVMYPWGPQHRTLMRDSALRERFWGFTMQGEDLPQPTNRIDLDPSVRDARGLPVARTTYLPHRHELVCSAHHTPRLQEILTRAGADWTVGSTSPAPDYPFDAPVTPISMSKHVMGTARMGSDPATTVTDAYGRLHDVPNVLVADASVFPTSTGYGPTLTLVALALRNTHALAGTRLTPTSGNAAAAREG